MWTRRTYFENLNQSYHKQLINIKTMGVLDWNVNAYTEWDTAPSVDKTVFNTLPVTITQGDHNIYQLILLN